MAIKLYSYWRSSCSYRVRICLALKSLQYETVAVHLVKNGGEQNTDDYKNNLNPSAQVPTFVDDGFKLTQSVAIMEYIDRKYSEGYKLYPDNIESAAKVRQVCEIINSGIQPIQNLSVLQKADKEGVDKAAWGRHFIERGFEALEGVLEGTSGKCCVGDEITAADACLVPQVYNAERFKVDMDRFPIIKRVNESLLGDKRFEMAHPNNQPDCPDNN